MEKSTSTLEAWYTSCKEKQQKEGTSRKIVAPVSSGQFPRQSKGSSYFHKGTSEFRTDFVNTGAVFSSTQLPDDVHIIFTLLNLLNELTVHSNNTQIFCSLLGVIFRMNSKVPSIHTIPL